MDQPSERHLALERLSAATLRVTRGAVYVQLGSIALFTCMLVFAGFGLWLYLEQTNLWLTMIASVIATGCGIGYLLTGPVLLLLRANAASMEAQQVDFVTKETALVNILDLFADKIASEFLKLGYPKRNRAESSLEIAKSLSRDMKALLLELMNTEGEVSEWFRELRESDGIANLGGLEGYLTTTGFQHDAVDELFEFIRERLDDVKAITQQGDVSTELATRLILAAQRFNEALELVRDYHSDRSLIAMDDIRMARQEAAE